MKRKQAPDWFGCGRVITAESWTKFIAARRAYYAKLDAAKRQTIPERVMFEENPNAGVVQPFPRGRW